MKKESAELLKSGYLFFPRVLLEELLGTEKKAGGPLEAFLLVLAGVNYSTTTCCSNGRTFQCARGESALTLTHWAEKFGWSRGRTRYFFQKMAGLGLIEMVRSSVATHIRIPNYDLLIGQQKALKAVKKQKDNGFDHFWQEYHAITQTDKINIAHARREWSKLSVEERGLAVKQIVEYYEHLRSVKYCMQAAMYLSNKAFLNEYYN